MTSLCFTFVLMFMPNAKVKLLPGLAGGATSGLLFIGWLWVCAAAQVGAARYGKIYGTFAVVPILLMWVYMSWQIVLFGAEVAFAVQNCETFRLEQGARSASVRARIILALSVVAEAARAMLEKRQGFEIPVYARQRRVPVRLLHAMTEDLVRAGLLARVSEESDRFVLLRPPSKLTTREVVDAVLDTGVAPDGVGLSNVEPSVRRAVRELSEGTSGGTVLDLVSAENDAS
jgi:membrane protein